MFETAMRMRILILLVTIWVACSAAYGQFSDTFVDGDFTSNPTWTGTTELFTINTAGQLQTIGTAAGQAFLTTSFPSQSLNGKEWNFFIRQTFAGSDNNQSRVYLTASGTTLQYTANGSAGVQGYFLRFGEGGSSDAIRLFRDDGTGTPVELAVCSPGAISASFSAGVRVTRSNSGLWTLFADYSGGTAYTQETTVTDATYTTSSNFGLVCNYTSSNADNFFFDNFYFGNIIVDTTPPALITATATSATTLVLQFSENITTSSAQNITNYLLTGTINPISANVQGSQVTLTFASPFTPNATLNITAINISDLAGNILATATQEFIYFVAAQPFFRAVVFNEVLADPTPVVGLPDVEFVEIFNPTNESFNLENWSFVNTTTVKTLPSFNLGPGQYAILTDANNTALFSNAIGISSFTALTNSTDSLTLLDNNGQIIDVLVYNDDWFVTSEKLDGGWTLEQINPLFPCFSAANWTESSSPQGGTPAAINSVNNTSPDITPPLFVSIAQTSPNSISISFNETMQTVSIDAPQIDVTPSLGGFVFNWNGSATALNITFDESIEIGVPYQFEISGPSDCSGNIVLPFNIDFIVGFQPQPGDIIINEIMAAPLSSATYTAEYLELYNKTEQLLDLSQALINSGFFTSQVIIGPGEYLAVGNINNADALANIPGIALMTSFPGLTNSGTTITLSHPENGVIDAVTYSDEWYRDGSKDDGGWSLELINPDDPCSGADNWRASNSSTGGTPGAINSVYDNAPDTSAPQIIRVFSGNAFAITILFNEPLDPSVLDNFQWIVNGENQTSNAVSFAEGSGNDALIIGLNGAQLGVVYTFTLQNISDCWGNTTNTLTGIYAVGETPALGDIVINEVLSNPFDGGSDFVEIYNNSQKIISLSNWSIANESNGIQGNPISLGELNIVLLPGEYLALTEDGTDLPQFYPFTRNDRVWKMTDLPSYNNGDGVVVLLFPDGTVADRFAYSEDMHFVLLDDLDGVSLERIDPSRSTDDPTNWNSAAQSQGFATPGYQNSQALAALIGDEDITITPEIFSPNNDGFEDVVTFSFNNVKPGMVGNVYIFDSNGRQVLHLMKNQLLAVNDAISWDGRTSDQLLAPIGIYIVYFEVFDENGNTSKLKKTCVLAQQLD